MSGHTPGPWSPGRQDTVSSTMDGVMFKAAYADSVQEPSGIPEVETLPMEVARFYGRTVDEVLANSRLGAAAPEMYELLRLWHDQGGRNDERAFDVGQAADQTSALLARIDGPDRSPAAAERDDGEAEQP